MILAPDALLRLLTWLSPAFPTGGFAYSHGLEWAVEAGDVHDGATLAGWLDGLIRWGSIRSDATLLRHAHRAGDLAALRAVTELATACAPARERQLESLAQGAAFCAAAAPWPSDSLGSLRQSHGEAIPYPVAVGVLASSYGIEEDPTCLAFLHAVCANMISAGVRLIPLGQAAGLRVLASLEPALKDLAVMSAGLTLGEIGGASLRPDIAAMRHETQYTRLFRS